METPPPLLHQHKRKGVRHQNLLLFFSLSPPLQKREYCKGRMRYRLLNFEVGWWEQATKSAVCLYNVLGNSVQWVPNVEWGGSCILIYVSWCPPISIENDMFGKFNKYPGFLLLKPKKKCNFFKTTKILNFWFSFANVVGSYEVDIKQYLCTKFQTVIF